MIEFLFVTMLLISIGILSAILHLLILKHTESVIISKKECIKTPLIVDKTTIGLIIGTSMIPIVNIIEAMIFWYLYLSLYRNPKESTDEEHYGYIRCKFKK